MYVLQDRKQKKRNNKGNYKVFYTLSAMKAFTT